MTEPVNKKSFGGVNFNWNQVKSAKVIKNKDGKETYFIEFKTGVTASYPLQKGNYASMESVPREFSMMNLLGDVVSGDIDYDTETKMSFIEGATIKGSSKDDHIVGDHVNNCTIDVSGDNNDDHVDIKGDDVILRYQNGKYVEQEEMNWSYGNKIILDKHDTATNKEQKRKYDDGYYVPLGFGESWFFETTVEGPGIENRF